MVGCRQGEYAKYSVDRVVRIRQALPALDQGPLVHLMYMLYDKDTETKPQMKCRVLVVEDSESDAFLISELLQVMGHTVEIARNGRDALRKLLTFSPHLILCDIMMPEMDGYEFASALRDGDSHSAVMVALTTREEFADGKHAKACGFDDCVLKPISITDLQRLVEMFS